MLQIVHLIPGGVIHPKGFHQGLQSPSIPALFASLPDVLSKLGEDNRVNIFYTLAHHGGLGLDKPTRSSASFEFQTVLPFDIDQVNAVRRFEYVQAVAQVLGCDPKALIAIFTGNGVHVLANLKHPYRSVKAMSELKPAYNELCHKIEVEMEARGLPGKADPVVFDPARIFRLPGTVNQKPGSQPKDCELLQNSITELDLDLMAVSGLDKIKLNNVSPEAIRKNYPRPDFAEMVKECHFVNWAITKPSEVHEPQAFDLFSLLAAQEPGSKVEFLGREYGPMELAEYVFDRASASKSLARGDFKTKFNGASNYGAPKCTTIAKNLLGACAKCPHNGRIATPLALRGKDHIGSEPMGYWVLTKEGGHKFPHYEDLSRVYKKEKTFVVTKDSRIFVFEESKYVEEPASRVKSWVETRMEPSYPLKDMHCSEFLKKVERVGMLNEQAEDELFQKSLVGKINCNNGVVDVLTGTLLPHSPQYGFQYMLPYDYKPDEASELFLDWLKVITLDRVDLQESLLDLMAYCLWPDYDDHVFAYFVGEGANGKSTLIHILQEILGSKNTTSVNIQQLGGNRFAPAQLEGKLANLSEESSGYEMSLDEMNIIKNLSAGGEILAERKGKDGFTFKNKAKLIFSANKPPKFKENGIAIQRRMVVIPFDYQITSPDSNIEKALIADVPKIVSQLVRRIQENVKANNGKFIVFRGGEAAKKAQEKILEAGNTTIEWAREAIDSRPDLDENYVVPVSMAYERYRRWCDENGHRHPSNKNQFSQTMNRSIIAHNTNKCNNLSRVEGRIVRVFKRARFKLESEE